ncbi:Aspartate aminotransferase [archaeon HR01]|nr:Aspartate aminotransferase [archaeon HR01]
MEEAELDRLRSEIREVSMEILSLLKRRQELAAKIGEVKNRLGLEIHQPEVEGELRTFLVKQGKLMGLNPRLVNGLATLLFKDSTSIQQKKHSTITHMDILRRGLELERAGFQVHHLEVGEPDLGAPAEVREAVSSAVRQGLARYGDSRGLPQLRKKIAEQLEAKFKTRLGPENILVVPGGRFAVYLALKTLVEPGDEVILVDPSWPMYRQCVDFVGGRAVGVKTSLEKGWRPDTTSLENAISPATKAIILNYPNNPTGKSLEKRDFEEIVEIAESKGLTIISDEVYYDYSFGAQSSILDGYDVKYVVVQSFSKSFGMTGYRIGYLVAGRETVDKMASLISLMITCVPEFIQYGALKALELEEVPKKYSEIMRSRMEVAVRELSRLPVDFYRPDGGMYVFPKLNSGGHDMVRLALELLESKGVAIAPGSIFGGYDSFFRISLGASEKSIERGITLLGEFLREKGLA